MGKIFYDMGFLASAEVIECSATDLVGQYVGQTGPKTQKQLEKGLGKVLFIDEAYRLAEGHFAKEAIDELVDCLTKPKFAQKLVIILAGYDEDINRLMSINPGLTSRFPEVVSFRNLSPEHCLELFQKCLQKWDKIDSSAVQAPSTAFKKTLLGLFKQLAQLPAWGNARDVKELAKLVTNKVLASATADVELAITEDIVLSTIRSMASEREHRNQCAAPPLPSALPVQLLPKDDTPVPPAFTMGTKAADTQDLQAPPPPPPAPVPENLEQQRSMRDPGVSDEIWTLLQLDKRASEEREKQHFELLAQKEEAQHQVKLKATAELEAKRKAQEESNAEARRLLEKERLKRQAQLHAQMEIAARLERERKAREDERRKEQAVQKKLREMGLCVAGFRWIKQATGYRCAGGSHFMSNHQLGI